MIRKGPDDAADARHAPSVEGPSASGRALIFVDDDGRVSGVIEAPAMADLAAAIEDDADDAEGPLLRPQGLAALSIASRKS
jgi:hypothetical protein